MTQFDFQKETIFTHLMPCLPLQLLDQTIQQTFCFKLILLVLQVNGIPAHDKQSSVHFMPCYDSKQHLLHAQIWAASRAKKLTTAVPPATAPGSGAPQWGSAAHRETASDAGHPLAVAAPESTAPYLALNRQMEMCTCNFKNGMKTMSHNDMCSTWPPAFDESKIGLKMQIYFCDNNWTILMHLTFTILFSETVYMAHYAVNCYSVVTINFYI